MAKKVEVSLSEYEWLTQAVKDYAFSLATMDVENQRLRQEVEQLKQNRCPNCGAEINGGTTDDTARS